MQTQTQPPLMRLPQVLQATGLKRSTIYKLIGLQTFPAPVKLTDRAVAWRANEVHAWIEGRTRVAWSPSRSIAAPDEAIATV